MDFIKRHYEKLLLLLMLVLFIGIMIYVVGIAEQTRKTKDDALRVEKKVLLENNMDMDSFSAVLVTHDHLDHIRHLGSFCKKLNKPVYTTDVIHGALARHTFTAPTIGPCRKVLEEGSKLDFAHLEERGKHIVIK